jgi:UDP-N-acetylglucosamine transferase subunit ALG13
MSVKRTIEPEGCEGAPARLPPFAALGLRDQKVLVVASTGGHIVQAIRICELAGVSRDSHIVTFSSPQTDQLTHGWKTTFVPYVRPRDYQAVLRAAPPIRRLLTSQRFDAVLSTGAGVAISALPWTLGTSVRAVYVESFARCEGPSLTGRIMRALPSIETFTQHEAWQSAKWKYAGDVATGATGATGAIDLVDAPDRIINLVDAPDPIARRPRILVTLGTIQPYRFDALVDRIHQLLPDQCDVTWQLGCTTRSDLPGRVVDMLPADEFLEVASSVDIVVSHGGLGTALALVDLGPQVILIPRRASRGEHVDDHQVQLCRELASRGAVLYREISELSHDDLVMVRA